MTMIYEKRQKIDVRDTALVFRGNKNSFKKPVFMDGDGEDIFLGDTISFKVGRNIFQTSGFVENIDRLRVACFSQLLNKWRYFDLVTNSLMSVI